MGGRIALLLGLFVAPAALTWLGHRLRARSARKQGAFWGGAIGHTLAIVVTLVAAMTPPVWWQEGGFWRDAAIHWSMLAGFLAGAAAGALHAGRSPSPLLEQERGGRTDGRAGGGRAELPPRVPGSVID